MKGLLFLLPLCFVVSLVYEATHSEDMRVIFIKGLKLFAWLAGGIIALAAVTMILGRII